jgi:tetratricopeptide (TPR) repeat protein
LDEFSGAGHRAGNFREAEEAYGKALEERPSYSPAYLSRGLLYAVTGRRKQALADFRKAVELSPEDERARAMLQTAEAGKWSLFQI